MVGEILFARRVSWLGIKSKDIDGVCVVINFRDPGVVNHILEWGGFPLVGTTVPLPLNYFYSPDSPQRKNGPNQPFFSEPGSVSSIPLANRFLPCPPWIDHQLRYLGFPELRQIRV